MNDKSQHLEMVQSIISRMGSNSFALKAISATISAAVLAFASTATNPRPQIAIAAAFPAFVFWLMDARYLRTERLFRQLYAGIDRGEVTPFSMDIQEFDKDVDATLRIAFSWSVLWYYLAIMILMCGLAISLWC